MEYPNYYYETQGQEQGQPPKQPRRGIGGYVIVAMVFMLIGALLASIIMPTLWASGEGPYAEAYSTPSPERTPGMPSATEPPLTAQPVPEAGVPTVTPDGVTRPMPELDGMAPRISDSVNPVPDIVEQVSSGVIGVISYAFSTPHNQYLEAGSGSGFIVSSEGYILTNAHVVTGANKLSVMLYDGREIDVKLVGYDSSSDVAVLLANSEDIADVTPLKLGDSDKIRVGEFVITIGDPTGRELAGTTTFGIVSATARSVNIDGQTNEYIQTDAAVNPGNSGGALINMAGEVIGITSAKTVTASYDEYGNAISAEGLGFAIPINDALDIAGQLITDGHIKRPGIGVSVIEWTDILAAEYKTVTGTLIYSVIKDGPGDAAGLEPNDIIVKIDGAEGVTQQEFVDIVKAKEIGESIELEVWRYGEIFTATLIIGDLNLIGSELAGEVADYDKFLQ